jgi:hypothetical protein
MTRQKVAWPATMVKKDGSMPPSVIAASKAMPVTMPGSAMGNTNNTVSASRPRKVLRASANAASVPRIMASVVAQAATPNDSDRLCQMSGREKATPNHFSVRPGGGNW